MQTLIAEGININGVVFGAFSFSELKDMFFDDYEFLLETIAKRGKEQNAGK